MKIIPGFGSTEEAYRSETKNKIEEIIRDVRSESKVRDLFTDEQLSNVEEKLKVLSEETRNANEKFTESGYKDAPGRYSYFYVTVTADVCDIFVGVNYFHINTKHPSPDGIAMMQAEESYWFSYDRI